MYLFGVCGIIRVHTITKKHYIPESTFNYQKALRKHARRGLDALFITILCVLDNKGGNNRYNMILKRVLQMIIELTISVQIVSCE